MVSDDGLTAYIPVRDIGGNVVAHALIDAVDVTLVNQWRWSLTRGYAKRVGWANGKSTLIYLHRLILGLQPNDGIEVDHINRNKLDDRRDNLRTLTHADNMQNVPGRLNSTSTHRGVHRGDGSRWVASLGVRGKNLYLGVFDSEDAAAEAVREARTRLMPYSTD